MLLADVKNEATDLASQGKLQEARPLWIEICEQEPAEIDNWIILSAIDEQLGFYPAALEHLKYAFHLDSKDPELWMLAASLHWKMRQLDSAFQKIYSGLALDFNNVDLRMQVAEWHLYVHKFDQAIAHYQFLFATEQFDNDGLVLALVAGYLHADGAFVTKIMAYCEANQLDLSSLDQQVADTVAHLVLPKKYKVDIKLDDQNTGSVQSFFSNVESLLAKKTKQDVQTYFDRMAHSEIAFIEDAEKEINTKISDLVISATSQLEVNCPGILELGCGVGAFGKELTASGASTNIIGFDFTEEALKVANKQNSYAGLLNYQQWQKHAPLLLNISDCVVVRARLEYYVPRIALIQSLINLAEKPLTIIVEAGSDSNDLADIESSFNQLDKQWCIRRVEADDESGSILYLSSDGLIDTDISLEDDAVEKIANKLVSAQTQFLAKNDYDGAYEIACGVLESYPTSSQALFIKGIYYQHNKDNGKAIAYFRRALRIDFGYSDAWFQLATVWHSLGRYQSMLRAYQQTLRFAPNHVMALKNLVYFYLSQGDWAKVNHYICSLVSQNPLSTELREFCDQVSEQLVYPQIKQVYVNMLKGKEFKKAQFHAALGLKFFARCEKLLEELSELIEEPELRALKVNLLDKSGRVSEAMAMIETLIAEFPDKINYLKTKRSLMLSKGDLPGAHQVFEQLLELYDPQDGEIQSDLFVSNYYAFCTDEEIKNYHFNWGTNLSKEIRKEQKSERPIIKRPLSQSRKIRIGYVSGDLKMHSVAIFLYNIYKHHNRDKFEIVSYSANPVADAMMMKMRMFSVLWRDISKLSNQQAAAMIRRDEIDILVDLSGHTGHNRLPLFCLKPAPIQGTYLGYANTTGLAEVDFRFTDEMSDPTGMTDHLHTEKLIRLPNGFLTYSRHFNSSSVYTSSQNNLERRYTFVCCNNIQKVNFQVVRVFCEILKQVPESNILIKAHNFNNPDIIAHYEAEFQRNGVSMNRVHLMNALDLDDHQELYNYTKIALDPYPYSGTTTTCDALWMGVPVLTLAGSRHSSRVSASLLNRVGLNDWIANSEEEYIQKAVSFVNQPDLLEEIKLSMRYNMFNSPLMHTTQVCRDIEDAYQVLWDDWCDSTPA